MRRERDQADESRERTDANPQPALKKIGGPSIDTRIGCRADVHRAVARHATQPTPSLTNARSPGLPATATIAERPALQDIGGRMSETENGAPKAHDKAMQHALLKEKRAYETCERLRAQCKTQASLMCRLFASKLQEQQAICARAISAPPGERAQVQAEADAFGASTRWILEEAAAAGLAQARDKEVEALREENEVLRKKVSELETKLVDNDAIIIEPEEPQSSLLMRRLEDERDKCRDEARAARGRVLELEGGMNARQAVDGEVAALRREVAALRSSNGHTDPDEIKRLKKEHKDALKKAKAALKAGGSSSEAEKEELMAAMEREVEQVVGEERARFDKERSRLEKELRKAKKGSKASGQQLSVLRDQVRAAKTEIQAAKQDAKRILKELPQLAKQTCHALMQQCGNMAHEVQEAKRKYHKELAERKRLHNLVQELRGNIRVYCRVRPVSRRELENGGDEGCRQCVQFPEDGLSVEVRSAKKEKTFEYDQVFACDSTQEKVYSEIADLVVSVLDGYNVCIFAYGQTGLLQCPHSRRVPPIRHRRPLAPSTRPARRLGQDLHHERPAGKPRLQFAGPPRPLRQVQGKETRRHRGRHYGFCVRDLQRVHPRPVAGPVEGLKETRSPTRRTGQLRAGLDDSRSA